MEENVVGGQQCRSVLQAFSELLNILACTSEREALNLAITLQILFNEVTRWQVEPVVHLSPFSASRGV